uniref:Uncharacterized protein n=1 Tax=Naja naja TaxID=35670 RepID=A0A8C6XTJ8_NAJNA
RLCTYACPLSEALNRSSFLSEITHYAETRRDIIMLDSSVLVAGVVIGVVLFLSCVAILIGSLRKNQCFRHLQLWSDASYSKSVFYIYFFLSNGTLKIRNSKKACGASSPLHPFPPPLTISYCSKYTVVVLSFRYEECVGPGAAQIYLPTEDPPPYSLIDPCQQNDVSINNHLEERGSTSTTMGRDSEGLVRIQDLHQPSTASSSPFPTETAPPYEAVVCEQNVPLPQVSLALLKSSADYHRTLFDRIA